MLKFVDINSAMMKSIGVERKPVSVEERVEHCRSKRKKLVYDTPLLICARESGEPQC